MLIPSLLPIPYYLCLLAMLFLLWRSWTFRKAGWGIPSMVVLITVGAWYLIDPLYNDYDKYVRFSGLDNLYMAWCEVLIFFIAFGCLVPYAHKRINRPLLDKESQIIRMMKNFDIQKPYFQDQVDLLGRLLVSAWIALMVIALFKVDFNFVGLFLPFLSDRVEPWARDRIGGTWGAVLALAMYFQLMLASLLGAAFILSLRSSTMFMTGIVYFAASSFYLFGRTRNSILAVMLPAILALVTLRIRGGVLLRILVLGLCFMSIDSWFKFIIAHRGMGSIAAQFANAEEDANLKEQKHNGFNMFEELGYINYFIANGTYKVNWGQRYFAELANPVPRALWPGKPMIGIDYALARGLGYGNQDANSGGIAASISTGMIGQGVVNFGRFLGPIASALLMAIWVAVLARLDLLGHDIGHLLLYAIGLALTFNMGRDITLLVLYPFIFGWLLLWWNNKRKAKS